MPSRGIPGGTGGAAAFRTSDVGGEEEEDCILRSQRVAPLWRLTDRQTDDRDKEERREESGSDQQTGGRRRQQQLQQEKSQRFKRAFHSLFSSPFTVAAIHSDSLLRSGLVTAS